MKENMPIVGWKDYGFLASVLMIGDKPYLCDPYLEMGKMTSENAIFLCRQNDQLSPLELFRILMWTLEESVIGGYKTIIEDAINFLKTNGVTMCDGEIRLSFTIDDKDVCLKMDSDDDRFIRMTHYDSLESMAESLYNVFKRMNEEFGVNADVIISFKGKKGEEFASILAFLNLDKSLNLAIFN